MVFEGYLRLVFSFYIRMDMMVFCKCSMIICLKLGDRRRYIKFIMNFWVFLRFII